MSKRRSSDESPVNGKKERNSVTLEQKLDVNKRYEQNKHVVDIASALGISEWLSEPRGNRLRNLRKTMKIQQE
jgi:hypothetical protein